MDKIYSFAGNRLLAFFAMIQLNFVSFAAPLAALAIMEKRGTSDRHMAATLAMLFAMGQASTFYPRIPAGLHWSTALIISVCGERIEARADLIIEANAYVKSIQPNDENKVRYEQGVIVSMVDSEGRLIPQQNGERKITPCPVLIRKGLDVDKIMALLSDIFPSWDYRHGDYY
jgi:hypothetical protein